MPYQPHPPPSPFPHKGRLLRSFSVFQGCESLGRKAVSQGCIWLIPSSRLLITKCEPSCVAMLSSLDVSCLCLMSAHSTCQSLPVTACSQGLPQSIPQPEAYQAVFIPGWWHAAAWEAFPSQHKAVACESADIHTTPRASLHIFR